MARKEADRRPMCCAIFFIISGVRRKNCLAFRRCAKRRVAIFVPLSTKENGGKLAAKRRISCVRSRRRCVSSVLDSGGGDPIQTGKTDGAGATLASMQFIRVDSAVSDRRLRVLRSSRVPTRHFRLREALNARRMFTNIDVFMRECVFFGTQWRSRDLVARQKNGHRL